MSHKKIVFSLSALAVFIYQNYIRELTPFKACFWEWTTGMKKWGLQFDFYSSLAIGFGMGMGLIYLYFGDKRLFRELLMIASGVFSLAIGLLLLHRIFPNPLTEFLNITTKIEILSWPLIYLFLLPVGQLRLAEMRKR